jgi:hypothetical protein
MRPIPEMIDGLRALANHPEALISDALFAHDAANFIEGASNSLREHMALLIEMRVRLEQVRPLMEQAIEELEEMYDSHYHRREKDPQVQSRYSIDMELPRAIRAMLRWWEPGAKEPVSISHWGIVE